jgi:DNA repair/transcription protein MET18/MMS19
MCAFLISQLLTFKQVRTPVDDEGTFLVQLLNWSIRHAKTTMQRECAWHIISAIVNKHASGEKWYLSPARSPDQQYKISERSLTPHFQRFGMMRSPTPLIQMRDVVPSQHGDGYERCGSIFDVVTYHSQISRSLLVRNHPQALPFVSRLFELFSDIEVEWDAARAIGQIGTADKVLTKRNHAVIKVIFSRILSRYGLTSTLQILHSQKYADSILPRIIEGIQNSTGQSKLVDQVGTYCLLYFRTITADHAPCSARRAHQGHTKACLCPRNADSMLIPCG